jgi:hypothetical protein
VIARNTRLERQSTPPAFREKGDSMSRVDRGEHTWRAQDAADTEHRDHTEPQQHQGSEHLADAGGPAALNGKEARQDSNCRRHDVGLEHLGDVDALDRAQDRELESARSMIRTLGQRAGSAGQCGRLPRPIRPERRYSNAAALQRNNFLRARPPMHLLSVRNPG